METLKGFILNVQSLPAGQSAVRYDSREREIPLREATEALEGMVCLKVEGLSFVLDIEKDDQEWVHVRGVYRANLSDVCSRCAERFFFPVSREIDITFIPQEALQALGSEESGDMMAAYQGSTIDLFPYLMEPVFLEMPMNPVCLEGCRGLCQDCGVNLNVSSCTCPKDGGGLTLRDFIVLAKQQSESTTQ